MKIVQTKLSHIKSTPANPRVIRDQKFAKLVNSILALPKMLELRPIVTDKQMIVLGGNQRLRALEFIAKMDPSDLEARVRSIDDVRKKKPEEIDALVKYWSAWQDTRTVPSVKADELTDDEQRQFIIKDNSNFGEWDYDMLANQWDTKELGNWGVDTWQIPEPAPDVADHENGITPPPMQSGDSGIGNLPPEHQGIDITPDALPKIEGDDHTAMERIIIVFPKEREEELAAAFGMEKFDKVVYNIDELIS